jgi:hypothetical protein
MRRLVKNKARRATVLVLIVGLLAMLFMVVTAYISLARFDRLTTRLAGRGQQTQQILNSVTDVLAGQIAQLSTGDLTATLKGANYAAMPGGKGTPWLVSMEPVLNPSWSGTHIEPKDYVYAAVTSLTGNPSVGRAVGALMLGDPNNTGVINPYNPSADITGYTKLNARQPFMDADGDGVSDTGFHGVALLTELANAMVGKALSIDPNMPADPNDPRWQYYDSQAQYEVAAKIVPHGGMVQIGLGDPNAWNAQFAVQMFNWLKHPNDTNVLSLTNPTDRAQLAALGAASASVEPFLRARGGLLTSLNGQYWDSPAVPPAVRALAHPPDRFEKTMLPFLMTSDKLNHLERFNLAGTVPRLGGEWDAWRQAVSMDADSYNNPAFLGTTDDPRPKYVRRRLLTTVSNSDELARKQQADPNGAATLGIRTGQLKFYLGDIQKAFPAGTYSATTGIPLIRELADYYAEMLHGYTGWGYDIVVDPNDPNKPTEALPLRQQAVELAVNTVAFAALHDPTTGYYPTVYYDDLDPNTGMKTRYFGYTPQPFITQVIACNNPQPDPNDSTVLLGPNLAVAIELYNPNDSMWQGNDLYALDLSRYALSIRRDTTSAADDPCSVVPFTVAWQPPPSGVDNPLTALRLRGRSFVTVAFPYTDPNGVNSNNPFTSHVNGALPRQLQYAANDDIVVKLWRSDDPNSSALRYVVDEMVIRHDELKNSDPNGPWYANMKRDTSYEPYLGVQTADPSHSLARWRMVVAFPSDAPEARLENLGVPLPTRVVTQLGGPDALQPTPGSPRNGPSVPLYTMNAGTGRWSIDGAYRPASFPTVGFMAFIPRFAHSWNQNTNEYKAMGDVLYKQWQRRNYSYSSSGLPPPADFGHMPIFDNKQQVYETGANASDFSTQGLGRLPWGLLVYDYFTTLSPNGEDGIQGTVDDIDPYRVPGRININEAPWYVLAGLPVIGTSGNLPLASTATPSFTNANYGVLIGTGYDGTTRRPIDVIDPNEVSTGGWYRLGAKLGQAVAAYRDRVPYVATSVPAPWPDAWRRSDPNYPASFYRLATLYGPIRSGAPTDPNNPQKSGFVTLGELANVMAFDASNPASTELRYQNVLVQTGDFVKAASFLALLDTHFLTTRSNTYTIYTTLTDRQDPQRSVHAQTTIDRSKLLPHLTWQDANSNGIPDAGEPYTTSQDTGSPEIISERQVSYFNTRYDE